MTRPALNRGPRARQRPTGRLLALAVAVALLGCAAKEDSAAGAEPNWARNADAPVAAAATSRADDSRPPPEETANRQRTIRKPTDGAAPKPTRTTTPMPRSQLAQEVPGGTEGDFKDLRQGLANGHLRAGFDGKVALSNDGDALVVGNGSGGMGMRGVGHGGGGQGFGRIGGLGKIDTAGGAVARDGTVVNEVSIEDLEKERRDSGRRAEREQARFELQKVMEKKKSVSKAEAVRDTLAGDKLAAEQMAVTKMAKAQVPAKDEEEEKSRLSAVRPANQPAPEPIAGKDIDLLVAEVDRLSADSNIRPQFQNGEMTGLKLGNVRVDSGMYKIGLRAGDVLRSVNGRPINGANKALAHYWTTPASGKVTLDIERDGRFRSVVLTRGKGKPGVDAGPAATDRWQIDDTAWAARPLTSSEPASTLPRMFYFENTYLGRTAAFQERLRRLDTALSNPQAYVHTALDPQRLDAPTDAGLSITTALDRVHPTEPGRVFLQVALQGSHRYGWRRPPLDLAVVLDPHAMAHESQATRRMLDRLLTRLGPQDRLGVVLATDPPRVLVDVQDLRDARDALRSLDGTIATGGAQIAGAMRLAGARLAAVSDGQARVPGSHTLLVVTSGRSAPAPAAQVAHALTVQGAVTSVIDLSNQWGWWSVANAGHGQLYSETDAVKAVDAELDRASKVVARLLRVNIKLAAGVRAIRVLGSRMLEDDEVKAVKAREEATDLQISKTMGVKADRGDDDDGIQTVIPFFYGGDAHVIMVELWVPSPRRGMPVAEVSLRYKDMVALGNATARSHATFDTLSGPTTPAELMVRRNVRGFELAEALGKASGMVARGQTEAARRLLDQAVAVSSHDRRLVDNLRSLLSRSVDVSVKQAALAYAGQRRISHVAAANP